ncbi:MAG: PmbA protein [Candidatus Binatia bacterium]|nr:MAG: PmbA protein [Candidatus Binatia bacterium]
MSEWKLEDAVSFVLEESRRAGAEAADVLAVAGDELSVGVRLGEVEKLKRARAKQLGLRVFTGSRSAVTSTADLTRDGLLSLVRDSLALARLVPPDECAGLPAPEEIAKEIPSLDLDDPTQLEPAEALDFVRRAEAAARAEDPRIVNSEGAELEASGRDVIYGSTAGFLGSYRVSNFSLWVVPVAARDGEMQRDSWYCAGRKASVLAEAEAVGRQAARRALRRLGARRVPTCEVPVVFEAPVAASLLRHLAAAVSGSSLYRGTSFLAGKLGERIAPETVTVVDDGRMARALGSRPFDAEGVPTRRTPVVERGRLAHYLFDTYSARKLGARSTGNAVRSVGGFPSVGTHNFYLEAGPWSPEEIVRETDRGLWVVELIGQGVNPVTGDYSRGAVGLWIEGGEFAFPVHEVTIAGNLLEMYRSIDRVGNDLEFRSATASPTVRIARMTVAGI